jgi:response regulator RpfG family c-di-GMP phosphodiesterase
MNKAAPGSHSHLFLKHPVSLPNLSRRVILYETSDSKAEEYGNDPENMKIHIMLVDDHTAVRQGIADLTRREPDFLIVGEASNGETALNLAREVKPDLILMDVHMPGMNGIRATELIHSENKNIHKIF